MAGVTEESTGVTEESVVEAAPKRLLIGGDWRDASGGATFAVDDPSTGETLCDPKHPIALESLQFPDPVISIAIEPRTKADMDRLGQTLERLTHEDPSFRVSVDAETGQTIISGMGELHLEIIADRLLREFNVQANVGRPQVAYKETITQVATVEGRYIKQTGGAGDYAVVKLEVA